MEFELHEVPPRMARPHLGGPNSGSYRGHVTVTGPDPTKLARRVEAVRAILPPDLG